MEFMNQFEPLLQTFWYIALPASLIFVIQAIMTFSGLDASDGLDADFDGDFVGGDAPFQLISLRNMINFLLGFSWTGISFYDSISSKPLLIIIAFLVGSFLVYIFWITMKQLMKLSENNSFKMEDTIGKTGDVYLTIPEKKSGKGKVLISIKGSVHELAAITANEEIQTSSIVKVIDIEDTLLIVEKL